MNTEIKNYISEFESVYTGDPWYGKPLLTIFKEVDPQKIFLKPVPHTHSVYEIAQHLYAWRDLLARRLNGDTAASINMNSKEDWDNAPDADPLNTWNEFVQKMEQNQKDLIAGLSKFKDDDLDKNLAGTKVTLRTFLKGQVQHDIYHIGQVALANKNNKN